jgi:hypothetical protein
VAEMGCKLSVGEGNSDPHELLLLFLVRVPRQLS